MKIWKIDLSCHTKVHRKDSLHCVSYFKGCSKGYYAARTGPLAFSRSSMICPRARYSDTGSAESCIQCPSVTQEGSTNRSNWKGMFA